MLKNCYMASIQSFLMIFQHLQRKVPIYPSGPGAFSLGMFLIVEWTSCSVKGTSKWQRSCGVQPNFSWFNRRLLGAQEPNCPLKCWYVMSCLSTCEVWTAFSVWRAAIKFFFFLTLVMIWKYLVLASPFLIHVSLDCCRALDRSIAARPRILFFSTVFKSFSLEVKSLCSCAVFAQ